MPATATPAQFQSSAAPKDGCNLWPPLKAGSVNDQVSILSRPERRLQRRWHPGAGGAPRGFNPQPPRKTAATAAPLKGSETLTSFNPQPPRKTAATGRGADPHRLPGCFNPQPPRKTAATGGRLAGGDHHAGFNPQPPRKTAATTGRTSKSRPEAFQSSAAPKDGCNAGGGPACARPGGFNPQPPRKTAATWEDYEACKSSSVSILSRPERRLQRSCRKCKAA